MDLAKAHIIQQLKREILPLEGLKVLPSDNKIDLQLPSLEAAFPNKIFPVGCIHELLIEPGGKAGASYGFLSFLLSKFMQYGGIAVWISNGQNIFPAALHHFGIKANHIVFVNLHREKDILFAIQEALKCEQLTAVIGEIRDMDFKQSRRLQLAAEKSRVTGFILHHASKINTSVASVSRWKISSQTSILTDGLPGVGYPRWHIDLQKIRNGSPGQWLVEYRSNKLFDLQKSIFDISKDYKARTG